LCEVFDDTDYGSALPGCRNRIIPAQCLPQPGRAGS